MFQRVGAAAYRADLTNITRLCNLIGNPQNQLRCIHIAGTNGKGSVTHIIASILQEQGYKVGVFVSPHYKDYRERIKINGKYIGKKFVAKFIRQNIRRFKNINASFFEMTTALAFEYFKERKTDFAVIETGMGGRLDSTNIITPLLSVITNISYDHMQFLGNTLSLIAREKAGIIKPHIPVVIGETQRETKPVFIKKAKETGSPIYFADVKTQNIASPKKGTKKERQNIASLPGPYQHKNITTALMAIELLKKQGVKISDSSIRKGIRHLVKNTSFIGRWMILDKKPLTIADSAHNEGGLRELLKGIHNLKYDQLHFVFGTVSDKDISKNLALLPKKATYYFCKANLPRALDEQKLQEQAQTYGLNGEAYPSVKAAFKAAIKKAGKKDLVLVAGSVFVVAEVI